MKKILMVFVAAVSFGLVACDGAKKSADDTTTQEGTETVVEEKVEEAATASEGSVLAKYEEFVNKAIPLVGKMKGGDASAAQEYAKLAEELGKFVQENQEAFSTLSEADAAKYEELAQKLAAAAQ